MTLQTVIIWALIGLVAGWIASFITGGGGLIRYILTGLAGAVVGGFLMHYFGFSLNLGNAIANEIAVAAIGAVVVVFVARILA
ncbi:GlsB/YeaQ/YmgE family stress response membrane protein [Pannonibacter sp. Q-1]|uniref:Transglycosylase associated protein n=2 Tax=Pannonibacter TaxID=227873 RepID=A0A0L0J4G8_9HYPH|nr:GlsB/YeaQ/YmgE family stress response membrane protein [Pannonibacter phragmitetus]ALV28726.1 hypothetical protein APZ00_18080 [Pannonibacter phragmitetus]KND20522.1 membrane protein [Pannonibacter phragmitetus]MBA4206465.1 GlsB/YeaQ/YmgE family stress response membrane protein [Polymorphum sp.]SUB01049.1 Uncharacterised protein [Pannonibacter phragmitetus]